MRVSDLMEALRDASPDAEVVVCLKVPDGLGDYLLFSESAASFAEPYPGDDGRFLVHSTISIAELASQSAEPSIVRELASALEREADSMENGGYGQDKWDDGLQ